MLIKLRRGGQPRPPAKIVEPPAEAMGGREGKLTPLTGAQQRQTILAMATWMQAHSGSDTHAVDAPTAPAHRCPRRHL